VPGSMQARWGRWLHAVGIHAVQIHGVGIRALIAIGAVAIALGHFADAHAAPAAPAKKEEGFQTSVPAPSFSMPTAIAFYTTRTAINWSRRRVSPN